MLLASINSWSNIILLVECYFDIQYNLDYTSHTYIIRTFNHQNVV